MKSTTRDKLYEAWQYCDDEDKSTEFMIEHMQDVCSISFDTVMLFIEKHGGEERVKWSKERKIIKDKK